MTKDGCYENTSADSVAKLNECGIKLMETSIDTLLDEVRQKRRSSSEKIRILDIGCGNSPYLKNNKFTREEVDLQLWDSSDLTTTSYTHDERGDFKKWRFPDDVPKVLNSFDIILLSATFHEIYRHWNLENLTSNSNAGSDHIFAKWFFEKIVALKLIKPDSVILLGELYHRDIWPREVLEDARRVQQHFYGHADPPTAFPRPSTIIYGAREGGVTEFVPAGGTEKVKYTFELEHFDECFSGPREHEIYDKIDHKLDGTELENIDKNAVKLIFENRRFATLLFRCTSTIIGNMHRVMPAKLISESLKVNSSLVDELEKLHSVLEKTFDIHDPMLRAKYDEIFVDDIDNSDKTCIKGIFPILANECAKLSCDYFNYKKMAPPERKVFWFSINSLVFEYRRYLPVKDNEDYKPKSTSPKKLYSVVVASSCKPEIDKSITNKSTESNEWVAIGFNHLLSNFDNILDNITLLGEISPPSFFEWMINLPKPPRSITITYSQLNNRPQEAPSDTLENAIEASTLNIWLSENIDNRNNIDNKHLLGLLHFNNIFDQVPQNTGGMINLFTEGKYCGGSSNPKAVDLVKERIRESIVSVFLDYTFLGRFSSADTADKIAQLDSFVNRWCNRNAVHYFSNDKEFQDLIDAIEIKTINDLDTLKEKEFLILPLSFKSRINEVFKHAKSLLLTPGNEKIVLPKVWIAFSPSSLVPGKQSLNTPGNVMLFTDRIYGGMLLDLITIKIEKTYQAIRSIESEWKTAYNARIETRGQTFSTMLTSFGHDGKRPAQTLSYLLDQDWPWKDKEGVARYLANSLYFRLGSYSSLIGTSDTVESAQVRLKKENDNASSHLHISTIWYRELISVILRCLVDPSTWGKIRKNLWPPNVNNNSINKVDVWQNVRPAFEPVLNSIRPNHTSIDAKSEESIHECVCKLAKEHRINISFTGFDLLVPQRCKGGEGESTEPRLYIGLAFLFSEFATNVFRHQYPGLSEMIRKNGISASLEILKSKDEKGYDLRCRFSPVDNDLTEFQKDWRHQSDKTFSGLSSIKATLSALGCTSYFDRISWQTHGSSNTEEFPVFKVGCDENNSKYTEWLISNLSTSAVKYD